MKGDGKEHEEKTDVNPIKLKILTENLSFCNKLDCVVIRRILVIVINALAYHCKNRYKIVSFIGLCPDVFENG